MSAGCVFALACAALVYSGFCRLVQMSVQTLLCIRLAFWALTVAAAVCTAAVVVWAYRPGWPAAGLAVCMAGVQIATSVLWREGVPGGYRAPK